MPAARRRQPRRHGMHGSDVDYGQIGAASAADGGDKVSAAALLTLAVLLIVVLVDAWLPPSRFVVT